MKPIARTFLLSGDIMRPGYVSVKAGSLKEALEKVDAGEFLIEDEQNRYFSFQFDGNVLNREEFTEEELNGEG